MIEMRKCVNCEETFELNDTNFYKRKNVKGNTVYSARCRDCQRIYNAMMQREYRARKAGKV